MSNLDASAGSIAHIVGEGSAKHDARLETWEAAACAAAFRALAALPAPAALDGVWAEAIRIKTEPDDGDDGGDGGDNGDGGAVATAAAAAVAGSGAGSSGGPASARVFTALLGPGLPEILAASRTRFEELYTLHESRLSVAKRDNSKSATRIAMLALSQLCRSAGELDMARRWALRSRAECTDAPQVRIVCATVAAIALEMGDTGVATGYATKAEGGVGVFFFFFFFDTKLIIIVLGIHFLAFFQKHNINPPPRSPRMPARLPWRACSTRSL
jgi:hypothetical protein